MSVSSTRPSEPDSPDRPDSPACFACGLPVVVEARSVTCRACGLSLRREEAGFFSPSAAGSAGADVSYPDTGAEAMLRVEESSFWFSHRNAIIALVLERFAPGAVLWDVGGGNGFQARALQQRGTGVVMLEPGLAGCQNAVARGVARVVRGSLGSLGLAPRSLAAVSLFDVVEHLPEPVEVLTECRRVLRDDGRIFLTVPAYQALWSDEDEYAEHHRRYTKALLEEHLGAAGLRLEYVSYFFQPLVLPIFLMRSVPYRLLPRRTKHAAADLSDHGRGGVAQRVIEALLARETRTLAGGGTLAFGSSIVAVARP